MRGKKRDLNKSLRGSVGVMPNGNITPIGKSDEPAAAHKAKARELRPWGLSKDEQRIWNRLAPQMAMLGRLKPHYVDALHEYCVVRARLIAARKFLDEEDWTYVTQGRNGSQYKSRPEVAQLNDDYRKWRGLVGEFGLAPAADRGMNSPQGDMFEDGWDDL